MLPFNNSEQIKIYLKMSYLVNIVKSIRDKISLVSSKSSKGSFTSKLCQGYFIYNDSQLNVEFTRIVVVNNTAANYLNLILGLKDIISNKSLLDLIAGLLWSVSGRTLLLKKLKTIIDVSKFEQEYKAKLPPIPKVIGMGAFGCAFRPPIKCLDSSTLNQKYLNEGYIMKYSLENRLTTNKNIDFINNIRKAYNTYKTDNTQIQDIIKGKVIDDFFVIPFTDTCTKFEPNEANECLIVKNKIQNKTYVGNEPVGYYVPYGGMTWAKYYKDTTSEFNGQDQKNLRDLIGAVIVLTEIGFNHNDLHSDNVTLQPNVRLIDWDLSGPKRIYEYSQIEYFIPKTWLNNDVIKEVMQDLKKNTTSEALKAYELLA